MKVLKNYKDSLLLLLGVLVGGIAGKPILAMTANAFHEDEAEALAAGMNGHIAKPIDVDVLYRTMSEFLR